MAFEMPKLKYERTALAPFMSEQTINFHYGKHLQNYVNTANKLVTGSAYEGKSLEEIIATASGPLFNNAAQAYNHAFFFNELSPAKVEVPAKLLNLINSNFGSFDEFKSKFSASAASLFGSGWTWLVQTSPNLLKIINCSNAGNPLVEGFNPILNIDVWEHAYYLDYQNRRADFIAAFFDHVDWNFVASKLK